MKTMNKYTNIKKWKKKNTKKANQVHCKLKIDFKQIES